jgi:hypothetical protein
MLISKEIGMTLGVPEIRPSNYFINLSKFSLLIKAVLILQRRK